jgi:hypothetical protein
MRTVATLIASLGMALAAFGLAVAAPRDRDGDRAQTRLLAASGAIGISNSHDGLAVFSASAARPGQQVGGTVRIGNSGTAAGTFSVRADGLQETPGSYGGRLSERLSLVLLDVTDPQRPATLYAGTPAALSEIALGTFAAGEQRDYRIAATLPSTGAPASVSAGDNRFQGARLTFGLAWRAVAPEPTATATPIATPTPTPDPAAPTRTVPAPATPAPAPTTQPTVPPASDPTGDVLGDALGLPSSRRCVKRRRLKIRLRAPGGARVLSATVRVGKRRITIKRAPRRPIVLRRLPARRFKVEVAVRASNGRTYKTTRVYRACRSRTAGAKRHAG